MGDYGFEGAGEFGGEDFPSEVVDNDFAPLKHLTKLHAIIPERKIVPMQMEYDTSFTVFPDHTNYNEPPSIFGGKMLAEMDNCAAMTARRALYDSGCTDAITVGVDNVAFHRPAYIGEIVHLHGRVIELGKKSIRVIVECTREDKKGSRLTMAKGLFTFCARKDGVPSEHGLRL